jgi:hypothetical protein
MKQRWDHSLLYLTSIGVFAIAVVIGALFMDLTNRVTHERTQLQSAAHLSELLDTVENTASIACFVGDQAIAKEVANGLLKNSGVLGVVIRNDKQELARVYRGSSLEQAPKGRLIRVIHSPLLPKTRWVKSCLTPIPMNWSAGSGGCAFRWAATGVQIAGTSVAIFVVLLIWIVRPIKALSDRLHLMNATAGDRLGIPRDTRIPKSGVWQPISMHWRPLVSSLEDEHTCASSMR